MSYIERLRANCHKFLFYSTGIIDIGLPRQYYFLEKKKYLAAFDNLPVGTEKSYIASRVNYYNQLSEQSELNDQTLEISGFSKQKSWSYYIDMQRYLSRFEDTLKFHFLPGDIRTVPQEPAFVKSRPITIQRKFRTGCEKLGTERQSEKSKKYSVHKKSPKK